MTSQFEFSSVFDSWLPNWKFYMQSFPTCVFNRFSQCDYAVETMHLTSSFSVSAIWESLFEVYIQIIIHILISIGILHENVVAMHKTD